MLSLDDGFSRPDLEALLVIRAIHKHSFVYLAWVWTRFRTCTWFSFVESVLASADTASDQDIPSARTSRASFAFQSSVELHVFSAAWCFVVRLPLLYCGAIDT